MAAMGSDEGRAAAFVGMLRSQDPGLRAFAFRLVGDDVDDVLQSAYLAAFRAMPAFRGEASLRTWLHRIVYTTALNHLRAAGRRHRLDQFGGKPELVPDVSIGVSERLDLSRALANLPVDQRAVLLLVDGQGLSYDEAASVISVNVGTIASRLSRARSALRALMREEQQ